MFVSVTGSPDPSARTISRWVWSGVSEDPLGLCDTLHNQDVGAHCPPRGWLRTSLGFSPPSPSWQCSLPGTCAARGPRRPHRSTNLLRGHLQFQELGLSAQHVPGCVDLYKSNPVNLGLGRREGLSQRGEPWVGNHCPTGTTGVYGAAALWGCCQRPLALPSWHGLTALSDSPPRTVARSQKGPEGVPGSKTPGELAGAQTARPQKRNFQQRAVAPSPSRGEEAKVTPSGHPPSVGSGHTLACAQQSPGVPVSALMVFTFM